MRKHKVNANFALVTLATLISKRLFSEQRQMTDFAVDGLGGDPDRFLGSVHPFETDSWPHGKSPHKDSERFPTRRQVRLNQGASHETAAAERNRHQPARIRPKMACPPPDAKTCSASKPAQVPAIFRMAKRMCESLDLPGIRALQAQIDATLSYSAQFKERLQGTVHGWPAISPDEMSTVDQAVDRAVASYRMASAELAEANRLALFAMQLVDAEAEHPHRGSVDDEGLSSGALSGAEEETAEASAEALRQTRNLIHERIRQLSAAVEDSLARSANQIKLADE